MKKVFEFLALPKVDGDIGLEIEVEGRSLPPLADQFWISKADNSLRGGIEYVFNKPRKIQDVPKLIRYLNRKFEENKTELRMSFRTSVHVHLNVQQLTWPQVLNVIYTFLILEEPLIKYCHPVRHSNRFCMRATEAEGMYNVFSDLFRKEDREAVRSIPRDQMRYAAINVEALSLFGSLEFRSLEGTVNEGRITTWCNLLHKLREYAVSMESPSHIYDSFTSKTLKDFVTEVFGEKLAKELNVHPEDVMRSFSLAIELPFLYRDSLLKKNVKNEEKMYRIEMPQIEPLRWHELIAQPQR